MKFDCGETWEEKKERLSQWHSFFAIIPRKVGDHDCRWLENIERRGSWIPPTLLLALHGKCGWWRWEYRAKEQQ